MTPRTVSPRPAWISEWPLALTVAMLAAMLLSRNLLSGLFGSAIALVAILLGLCAVILIGAVAIVRHADVLAHRLGEPFGTLLLTLAVTGLEVAMVGFTMSTGDEKPTLARDTMFAVVMLVLNGFMGMALLLGGLKHREQTYNLQSANAFLVMIIPLTVLGLVLPNFTKSTEGPTLTPFQMVFLSVMSVAIYAIFLYVQNKRHRGYFMAPAEAAEEAQADDRAHDSRGSTAFHAGMLAAYGLPLVLLAKQMSYPLDAAVLRLGAPVAIGGFVVAVLVLTPESIAAVKAAREDRLQRSVNILLGSVLASIGLTIPLVITISLISGRSLILGLEAAEMVLLALTLATCILTFLTPRTNVLVGCVHLLLFATYAMLIFD